MRRAADGDLAQPAGQARFLLQCHGHVGAGADGGQHQLALVRAGGLYDEVDGVLGDGLGARGREVGAVQPGLAVGLGDGVHGGDEGGGAAHGDGHVDAAQGEDGERVVGHALQRVVAVHGGEAEQVEMARGVKDRDGVVVAGVAIDQDSGARHVSSVMASV
jgi:hypothetical protein